MFSVVFPGQGSQFVGMGKELHSEFSNVRELFQQADDVLDFEVRYLNMDNDTAVEISKYENISFSGSDYNLASFSIFCMITRRS